MQINRRNSPLFSMGRAKWDAFVTSYRGPYDFSRSVYAGMNQKVQFVCPTHGDMQSDAKNLMAGRQCQKCLFASRKGSYKTPSGEWVRRFATVHGATYDYSSVRYKGQRTPILIRCRHHGEFTQLPGAHAKGAGCPACFHEDRRGASQRDTLASFSTKLQAAFGGHFELVSSEYTNSQTPISVRCLIHNQECSTRPNWLLSGCNPCSKCNHMRSQAEADIFAFISSRVPAEQRCRTILAPAELDIWVPGHKLGVEHHGLYWHSANRLGGSRHREKWEAAEAVGVQLIQIFEDEWNDKRSIIEARLEAMLGLAPRYDARKLRLGICAPTEGVAFLNHTHIQGSGRANLYYGLWEGEELRAVASFGKARTGAMTTADTGEWEVIRYASTGIVRGGFSRLFRKFVADINPTSVISYCDLRYGNGRVYKASGFSLDLITPPDYWWVPRGKVARVPRYQTQKHKLERHPILKAFYKPELSEAEICAAAGWSKIYGVGHQRWRWTP